jgi:hypothetical protein
LEIDHKLITTPEELITKFSENDQKTGCDQLQNPRTANNTVEIDLKKTGIGGVCEYAEDVEADDPWIDQNPADFLVQLAQPDAIAPTKTNADADDCGSLLTPVEIEPEAAESVADGLAAQTITTKPTDEAIAATPESESKSSESGEILTSGEAVGRMVYTKNRKGEISRESWKITKWCERNGFYTLENGEVFYPCELVLTT